MVLPKAPCSHPVSVAVSWLRVSWISTQNSVTGRSQLSPGVPINSLFSLYPKVNDDDGGGGDNSTNELHKLQKF